MQFLKPIRCRCSRQDKFASRARTIQCGKPATILCEMYVQNSRTKKLETFHTQVCLEHAIERATFRIRQTLDTIAEVRKIGIDLLQRAQVQCLQAYYADERNMMFDVYNRTMTTFDELLDLYKAEIGDPDWWKINVEQTSPA